jgi:putative addiction module component (TIGR02574 family)
MKSDAAELEERMSHLSRRERARLALRLIESLDPGQDEEADELWLDEAERRLAAYDSGKTVARDAEEAFSEIERHLK